MNRKTLWMIGSGWAVGAALVGIAASGVVPGLALGRSDAHIPSAAQAQPADGSPFHWTQTFDGTVVPLQPDSESLAPPIFARFPTGYAAPGAGADTDIGHADFSQAEAMRRFRIVAGAIATQLFGSDVVKPDTGATRLAYQVDGHPVALDDLDLKEFRFIPAATSYTTVANTSGGFAKPTDAWIGVWERDGITAPNQPAADLRIVIVMEDATGAIHSVQAGDPASAS